MRTPEQALQNIVNTINGISGFNPPQVRLLDQDFQVLATVIVRDRAREEAAAKVEDDNEGGS